MIDSKEIFKQIQANTKRIEGCAGPHEFDVIAEEGRFPRYFKCRKCGGKMESLQVGAYVKALKHALNSSKEAMESAIRIKEESSSAMWETMRKK